MTKMFARGAGVLLLVAGSLSAAPITNLISTGVNLTNNQDQNWFSAASNPCPIATGGTQCSGDVTPGVAPGQILGLAFSPVDQASVSPVSFGGEFWNTFQVSSTSNWITYATDSQSRVEGDPNVADDHINFGGGLFYFRTTFNINDPFTDALIEGEWWADGTLNFAGGGVNDVTGGQCGIYLNGTCVYDTLQGAPASFAGPTPETGTPFSISSGFQSGANTLVFVVRNTAPGNEMGLRVTLAGEYENNEVVPEPGTYALMAAGLGALALLRRRRSA